MKKKAVSAALAVCAALGWWGAIYPQFTLLRGTYEIVYEEDECSGEVPYFDDEQDMSADALYWRILDADCSSIRFKSRLLTNWYALLELRREVNESGDE